MWDMKACITCFSTKRKLYKIHYGVLREYYFSVTGLKPDDTRGMPQYLCSECAGNVRSFKRFQDKCKRAHFALKEIIKKDKEIKLSTLEHINPKIIDIDTNLAYLNKNRAHYEEAKFQWTKTNRLAVTGNQNLFILHYGTFTVDKEFEVATVSKKPRLCFDGEEIKIETDDGENLPIKFSNILNQDIVDNIEKDDDDFFDKSNIFDDEKLSKDFNVTEINQTEELSSMSQTETNDVDGASLNEEYATLVPLTSNEAKAVVHIYKMMTFGKFKCKECNRNFRYEKALRVHMRMHDQFTSGQHLCKLCHYYYKTDFLLKTHIHDKHMYKYLCRSCNEVNYDRSSSRQHYIWSHSQEAHKRNSTSHESNPTTKIKNKVKGPKCKIPTTTKKKINIKDTLKYTPVKQEDQYALVLERKLSRNYMEAQFKCELCYRGFRETITYEKHMKKHNPEISGELQCDMCKLYFRDTRKLYKHMQMLHLFKYACTRCDFTIYNRGQALSHYKEHKNITYKCHICDLSFKKASTRLTHIRIKHPSTYICTICGHSFVSEMGLHCHMKLTHTAKEMELASKGVTDHQDSNYCAECDLQFLSDAAFGTHLGSSRRHATTNVAIRGRGKYKSRNATAKLGAPKSRGRPNAVGSGIVNNGLPTATNCEVCNKLLINDVQARKHYESHHPGTEYLKRYMCHVCGHTTKTHANLMIHMRTHTQEKPYACSYCDRRFSMSSNRDRHIVVHTGEKPYQCHYCSRRFSQSAAVKLHVQTVHLKIPYPPWSKTHRKRRKKELQTTVAPILEAPTVPPPPPIKMTLQTEVQGDYINTYITYTDG